MSSLTNASVTQRIEYKARYVWSFKDKGFMEHFASKTNFHTLQSPMFGHDPCGTKFYLSLTYSNSDTKDWIRDDDGGTDKPDFKPDSLLVFLDVSTLERRKMEFKAKLFIRFRDVDGRIQEKEICTHGMHWGGHGCDMYGRVDIYGLGWYRWKSQLSWLSFEDFASNIYELVCTVDYNFSEDAHLDLASPGQCFTSFYRDTSMADITLYVAVRDFGFTKFEAHKLVLSAQSRFFLDLFAGSRQMRRYDFVDCTVEAVATWLEFVYTQQIEDFAILKANADKLMHFAGEYEMPSLANYIEDQFAYNMVVGNAITGLRFALSKELRLLKKFALYYIYGNLSLVILTEEWAVHVRNRKDFTLINVLFDNIYYCSVQFELFKRTYPQQRVTFEDGTFEDLRTNGLVEGNLRVNGNDYPVHMTMLIGQSAKFDALFKKSRPRYTIIISDYSEAAVKAMLDLIYFQRIPFATLEQVSEELLKFAEEYEMPCLRRSIIEQYCLNRVPSNCLDIYRFALRNKLDCLVSNSLLYVWNWLKSLRKTDKWVQTVVEANDFDLIERLFGVFPTVVNCKCHALDGPCVLVIDID